MKKDQDSILEFSVDLQKLFIEVIVGNSETWARVQNIFNPENFDRRLQPTAEFIKEHYEKYGSLPDYAAIEAKTGQVLQPRPDVDEQWFFDEFEKFTRHRELERAILKSADLLEKGNFNPVEKIIRDAIQIGLTKELGTNYFHNIRQRLESIKDKRGQHSTGWPALDNKLYGGFSRGELQIFAGGSGSGKSLFMQNLAVNWTLERLNGVYVTLELSEELCAWRIDGMMSGITTKEVFRSIDEVEMKLGLLQKKAGKFFIKYLPAQSNVNDIRAYIKALQVEHGIKIDFLCIDYLDLLMPVSAKVSPNDLFVKDKYVSEELRNLAKELDVLFVTASQLNRSAVEEIEFDHSHISGGISKINTADNVFGIFTSRSMREKGRYQIQLMKTRSSSGVGSKIDLEFNNDTLRISDLGEEESRWSKPSSASIMGQIRGNSRPENQQEPPWNTQTHDAVVAVPKAKTEGVMLKGLLNASKSQGAI